MRKKVLAIISIPIWLLIAFSAASATMVTIAGGADKPMSYKIPFFLGAGLCAALFCWLLFFWGRWVWRVLFQRKQPVQLEWPD
ncbi:MAG TPA: hypothetical protein PK760_06285 [Flavobacteriales bacterium]|nr:hypothetical protein [Flavobacteriales bacterium]